MRVFVTGGTGLLGNTIIRQLADAGHDVLALVRGEPDPQVFAGTNAQLVTGDLCSSEVIDAAIESCDAAIHSAGLIHLGWHRLQESMQVNRDWTQTIVDACLKWNRKLVHVGTVNALAVGDSKGPSNEETPLDHAGGQVPCSYVVSKRAGIEAVQAAVERGLQAAIVHPGFMLGPWDWKPSSGRMMWEVGRAWRPIVPAGGCSVCDSRDVAAGTIAAMLADPPSGRQFILAGENWTYKKLWSEMASRMGRWGPIVRLGPVVARLAGWGGDAWTKLSSHEGDLNSAGIQMSGMYHWHDSSRARQELGYRNRDPAESLDAAAEWLRVHHPF